VRRGFALSQIEQTMSTNERAGLLEKRLEVLDGVWVEITGKFPDFYKGCSLHPALQREVVESYLNEREVYKLRNRIPETSKIMLHKVAGIITASICKFKPVQLSADRSEYANDMFQNERFALWTGLSICSEPYRPHKEHMLGMLQCELFYQLEKDLLRLFQLRPDSPEAFVAVYHAICLKYMPTTIETSAGE